MAAISFTYSEIMNLLYVVADIFNKMELFLQPIDNQRYQQPLEIFNGSSLGQHTRHVIEFFQCLIHQCPAGKIDYAKRNRDQRLETETHFALQGIMEIKQALTKIDFQQPLDLISCYSQQETDFHLSSTTFERELVYNIEHAVHHMAMIRIGLQLVAPEIILPKDFGVARSTLNHSQKTSAN